VGATTKPVGRYGREVFIDPRLAEQPAATAARRSHEQPASVSQFMAVRDLPDYRARVTRFTAMSWQKRCGLEDVDVRLVFGRGGNATTLMTSMRGIVIVKTQGSSDDRLRCSSKRDHSRGRVLPSRISPASWSTKARQSHTSFSNLLCCSTMFRTMSRH
jgi:hypothetical protein